jgi:peptidoglycan DL-endopeptidase CwlO
MRGSGWTRIAISATTLILLLPVVTIAAAGGILGGQASACAAQPQPSALAVATIPASYLAWYQVAGREYGIPWEILAGIGEVESDNGQSNAPGVHSGANAAGAAGPMQFGIGGAAGNTWGGPPVHPASLRTGGYGIDGDHDGMVDVYDPGDAIPSAAAYLRANGAPGDIQAALFAYNHSQAYVTLVLAWAARYADAGTTVAAIGGPGCELGALGAPPGGVAGKVIAYAEAQIGKPYQWGATGPAAFDCSGLVMMAYRAAGIFIPRTSQQQWAFGTRVPAAQVQPGDLVFFAGADGTLTAPGHVGIVIRPGLMIDAPAPGLTVRVESYLNSPGLAGFTQPVAAS